MQKVPVESFVLAVVLWACFSTPMNGELIVTKVDRSIDLTSHLVKITTKVAVENTGTKAVDHVHFSLDSSHANEMAYIGASNSASADSETSLVVTREAKALKDGSLHKIKLAKSLAASSTVELTVETVFTNLLEPYPSQITQSEKQLVRYRGSHYVYSPYKVKTQSTTVKLASSNVIQYSKQLQPVTQTESVVKYGPYDDVDAYTKDDKLVVHYENNNPFLTVLRMERAIEVSHWGNIAVEETFHMRHTGAILKGPFSRYDYQRNAAGSGVSSIRNFKTHLPASATDVYYRDEIGNISTSHMLPTEDSVELQITPRFPLFGGWQTEYYVGYNVPSYEYLYYSGSHYRLKMRLVDHIYDDQCIQEFVLKIILPEGTRNMKFRSPFPVEEDDQSLHFTYLDTVGRSVVTVRAKNLVEQHIQDFELDYDFQGIFLLQEPLLVVCAFYLLFTFVIVVTRLDFSITTDASTEAALKAASQMEHVESLIDQALSAYDDFDQAIDTLKSSKDLKKFTTTRKQLDGSLKQVVSELPHVAKELRPLDAEAADKVQ
jgi:oligosaccharyltransferase complex subunit alpha (ribophorin I)